MKDKEMPWSPGNGSPGDQRFPRTSKDFKGLQKTSKDFQRFPKISKNFRRPPGPGDAEGWRAEARELRAGFLLPATLCFYSIGREMNCQIFPQRKALSRDPAGADSDGIVIPGATLTRGPGPATADAGSARGARRSVGRSISICFGFRNRPMPAALRARGAFRAEAPGRQE
ncbi:MAG: hypothetical protein ABR970_18210, partial [Roseiarcus sp.]